ncbi:hypothetical protein JNB71_13550 [Rhizobium herbae]|uniref:Uncharacterized protein n=1 Tax=Rhizobium herbae TaxID=508661 RepID=A0ABS7HAQ7_9HYPH|nr:hypothetical protein [Rhizobium herbae]MBW9064347.1 hypothetical protein [Rhizobium herbae]
MRNLRYSARKNDRDEYWSVIDIFTGQPTFYKNIQLDCLDFDEVDDMVDCLNYLNSRRMGTLKQP